MHLYLKNEKFVLLLIFLISVLIRIPAVHFYGDTSIENEWGIIVHNLVENGKFSFRNLDGFLLPNLYMPPLYPFFLYLFTFFNLTDNYYILLILYVQLFLSSIAIVIFYLINKKIFSKKISILGSLIFSFFPLYIYACTQISSITLQVFLTLLFIYSFFEFSDNKKITSIFSLSIAGGLLILLRGEFIIIFFISLFFLYLYLKVQLRKILIIMLISTIIVSPYLIRNILTFDTITITKSVGYNLWKGNNPNSLVEGSEVIDDNLVEKIEKINKDKFYQIKLDKIFFNEAVKNILENPIHYFLLFIKKIFSFLLFDISSSQNNYYNYLHILPVIFLSITSFIGIFLANKKSIKYNYLLLLLFAYTMIFSAFFILPRYKLIIIPMQIIFTNVLVKCIVKKFVSK